MYIDAKVKNIADNNIASVVSLCANSCESCKGSLFCKQKDTSFEAKDKTKKAKSGDKVRVYLPKSKTILSSSILFLIPLLCMAVFLILGNFRVISELLSSILSVVSLIFGFFIVFLINKKNRAALMPEIIEVYES